MKEKNLKIGIITAQDPTDKSSWSGIYYKMIEALKNEFESIVLLGPVRLGKLENYKMRIELRLCSIFHKIFYRKMFNGGYSHIMGRYHSRFFDKKLKKENVDVVFAPVAATQIAHLKIDIPICFLSDATIAVMLDYYSYFSNLSKKAIKIANEIEQRAISKSTTQVYSSQWAFDSAKLDYNAKNPFIVKFGANFDEIPNLKIVKNNYSVTNLLFVGLDWERKGGDIVLATVDKLYKKGHNVHLTICGCLPPKKYSWMTIVPFLNKNKHEEMLQIQEIFKKAHLFFLPTRADCTPIVFCEANAYGLPVITTNTGGVSSVIENGVNGYTLPIEAKSEEYFNILEKLITDKDLLLKMAKLSRKKYESELNWGKWGAEMRKILLLTKSNWCKRRS